MTLKIWVSQLKKIKPLVSLVFSVPPCNPTVICIHPCVSRRSKIINTTPSRSLKQTGTHTAWANVKKKQADLLEQRADAIHIQLIAWDVLHPDFLTPRQRAAWSGQSRRDDASRSPIGPDPPAWQRPTADGESPVARHGTKPAARRADIQLQCLVPPSSSTSSTVPMK